MTTFAWGEGRLLLTVAWYLSGKSEVQMVEDFSQKRSLPGASRKKIGEDSNSPEGCAYPEAVLCASEK